MGALYMARNRAPTPSRRASIIDTMRLSPGDRFADCYVVETTLGEGGMGVVVRARDERLDRSVAVKVLTQSAVGDAVARARLVREARAVAKLEHAGIVHVYDVGETEDGGAFLVMELVRGRDGRAVFADPAVTPQERIRIVVDAAKALRFAHDQGFVHRDIKPDNLMVRDDGRVTVLDFGLAKPVATEASIPTARPRRRTSPSKAQSPGPPPISPPSRPSRSRSTRVPTSSRSRSPPTRRSRAGSRGVATRHSR